MPARKIVHRVSDFRGINTRKRPSLIGKGEFSDALNVDCNDAVLAKRNGFKRLAGPFKNASIRLDGVNDYLRITNISAYQPTTAPYLGIGVRLNQFPSSAVTIISQGYGAVGNLHFDLKYDPTAGTGSLGAWVFRIRSNAGATNTFTVDDGDGFSLPEGHYRFIEFFKSGSNFKLRVWKDEAGTYTDSSTVASFTSNWNSGQDIFIGVGTTTTNTIGTDFAPISVCELRYDKKIADVVAADSISSTENWTNAWSRELSSHLAAYGSLTGYWKFNDGSNSTLLTDSTTNANHAQIPLNPPQWVLASSDSTVLGQSALKFTTGAQWIELTDTDGTKVATTFGAPTGINYTRWTVRGIYKPALPPGKTTVPDGVILWAGTSTTVPAPISIRIVSDAFEFMYNENGLVRTLSVAGWPTVTSLVSKRVRFAFYRFGSGNSSLVAGIAIDNGSGSFTTYFTTAYALGATPTPSTISSNWAFGRHVTNFANARLGLQTAFHTDGTLSGTLDDLQIIWTNTYAGSVGIGFSVGSTAADPFHEVANWNSAQYVPVHTTQMYMRLNDGGGNRVKTEGPNANDALGGGWRAYIYPEVDDGAHNDVGLVDTAYPVRGAMCDEYDHFNADGSNSRSVLCITGCTVSRWDGTNLKIVGAVPVAADVWTSAQYGERMMIAGANSRRPLIIDGDEIRNLGIRAPLGAPVVTAAAGGSFTNGTYYVYVTFRNKLTQVESNPSPAGTVTFGGGSNRINPIVVPISSDPQVTQRRIYMTAVGGADGSTAYLVTTIDDNTTSSYATNIDGPVSTSAQTLEYYNHEEAPETGVVGQFYDRTFLGANPRFPTRLYYSSAGTPEYWNTNVDTASAKYYDLNLDSGASIVAIAPLINRLIVDLGKGKFAGVPTGDSSDPYFFERVNNTHGAVGPRAYMVSNNEQWYIGELDFYVSDGVRETNITAPDAPPLTAPVYIQNRGLPSIQDYLRDRLDLSGRTKFCVVDHRTKNYILFGVKLTSGTSYVTGGSNTHLLVYDRNQTQWWLWDIPLDCGCLTRVSNTTAEPVGIINGYLCALDRVGYGDGIATSSATLGTVTATNDSSVILCATSVTSGSDPRFLRFFASASNGSVSSEYFVLGKSGSSLLIKTASGSEASSYLANIAGITMYVDFCVNFMGDPIDLKKMLLARATLSSSGTCQLRFQIKPNVFDPGYTLTSSTSGVASLTSTSTKALAIMGGLGRNFLVRVSDNGNTSNPAATGVFPSASTVVIHAIEFEGEEKSAR